MAKKRWQVFFSVIQFAFKSAASVLMRKYSNDVEAFCPTLFLEM